MWGCFGNGRGCPDTDPLVLPAFGLRRYEVRGSAADTGVLIACIYERGGINNSTGNGIECAKALTSPVAACLVFIEVQGGVNSCAIHNSTKPLATKKVLKSTLNVLF